MDWLIGSIVSAVFAGMAYQRRSLSLSGFFAAALVGTSILGGIGWLGFLIMGAFFVTSSWLSQSKKTMGDQMRDQIEQKGERRDALQVLANGGVAAGCALGYAFSPSPLWLMGFSASLAAATSDTWASEVGKRSGQQPVHILTWKKVQAGTSGGITGKGTLASFIGAWMIAFVSLILFHTLDGMQSLTLYASILIVIGLSGWIGNWIDTLVGACWQGSYRCAKCGILTEKKVHCEHKTKLIKGFSFVDNDAVNVLCTLSAAIMAILFGLIIY